jgi:N-[(2S)-2-amino-2-carboxyethyl]-L-glutamate dehydrogenase
MGNVEILYLSQEEVIQAGGLDMNLCLSAVEEAFRCHALGQTVVPPKAVLRWGGVETEETDGRINALPGYLGGSVNMAGIKWIGTSPGNKIKSGLPTASALIILNDRETKLPLVIMEGSIISAMRTGAVGGLAAKYLARKDSRVYGFIGAGTQARTQSMAAKLVWPAIERFIIYDIDIDRARAWGEEMKEKLGSPCDAMASGEAVVRGSDVFATVTNASEPFVKAEWIRPGQTEIHIGSHEDASDVLKRADKIVVDDLEQILHRNNQSLALAIAEGTIRKEAVGAELGEIIVGRKSGRDSDRQFIYFDAIGMGHEDVSFAARIYQNAKARGIGQMLPLWRNPIWV